MSGHRPIRAEPTRTIEPGLLLVPGPVNVEPEVLRAQAVPPPFHQDAPYGELVKGITANLCDLLGAPTAQVLCCGTSGTGALEAAILNVTSPGDDLVIATNGQFGDRLVRMGRTLGRRVTIAAGPWHRPLGSEVLSHVTSNTKALVVAHLESSTGVVNDIRTIASALPARCLLIADCVSTVGATHLRMDDWGVDVIVGVSGKALGATPGIAFTAVSPRACKAHEQNGCQSFYFDWTKMRDALAHDPPEHAWTPPISIALGLAVALERIAVKGLDRIHAEKMAIGRLLRRRLEGFGFELYGHDADWVRRNDLPLLVAAYPPDGIDPETIVRWLRDQRGVQIARGQGKLKGRVVRIAYFGAVGLPEIARGLSAIEDAVSALGRRS